MKVLLSITTPEAIPAGSILNVVEDAGLVEINVMSVAKCLGVGERKAAPKREAPAEPVAPKVPTPIAVAPEGFHLSDGKRMSRSVRRGVEVIATHLKGRPGVRIGVQELIRAEYGAKATEDDYNHVRSAMFRLRDAGHVAVEAKKWRWVS